MGGWADALFSVLYSTPISRLVSSEKRGLCRSVRADGGWVSGVSRTLSTVQLYSTLEFTALHITAQAQAWSNSPPAHPRPHGPRRHGPRVAHVPTAPSSQPQPRSKHKINGIAHTSHAATMQYLHTYTRGCVQLVCSPEIRQRRRPSLGRRSTR